MAKCPKHPKFDIKSGIYFRAADPNNPYDWIPKNEKARAGYCKIAASGDLYKMAQLMGEAQLIHSQETSKNSGYDSVAKCPLCLVGSTDPTVQDILNGRGYLCQLEIKRKNEPGAPYIFDMGGEGIGATETEALVLLADAQSLLSFHIGYYTTSYIDSFR